jgi:hypothetical protein
MRNPATGVVHVVYEGENRTLCGLSVFSFVISRAKLNACKNCQTVRVHDDLAARKSS